jgi:hypothetical protein
MEPCRAVNFCKLASAGQSRCHFSCLFIGHTSAWALPRVVLYVSANASLDQFGPVLAERLARVYGGSRARFRQEGPRALVKANAMTIAKGPLVPIVIGSSDETHENNAAFHDYLELLKIPHDWIVLKGVGHDPEAVLKALGDANWSFYRKAFGAR